MNPVLNETVLLADFCQNDIFFGYPASLFLSVLLVCVGGRGRLRVTGEGRGERGAEQLTFEYVNYLKLLGLTKKNTLTSRYLEFRNIPYLSHSYKLSPINLRF